VTGRELEGWETSAPAPFVTIRAGGPFQGVVTISAIPEGKGRGLVEATWTYAGEPRSVSTTVDGYAEARVLAHGWADQLAEGQEPAS
jgi:hypothetical protein